MVLERSDSMEEMVANINAAFYDNEVVATINDDGKLVLSNDDGATIRVADISGTDNAYDGATGFEVQTVADVVPVAICHWQTDSMAQVSRAS